MCRDPIIAHPCGFCFAAITYTHVLEPTTLHRYTKGQVDFPSTVCFSNLIQIFSTNTIKTTGRTDSPPSTINQARPKDRVQLTRPHDTKTQAYKI